MYIYTKMKLACFQQAVIEVRSRTIVEECNISPTTGIDHMA